MANTVAMYRSKIWRDKDFLNLGPVLRDLWFFMLGQDDLTKTGVIAVRLARWSDNLGITRDDLVILLEKVAAARFFVIDWAAEELLIRTYIRNDEVYKKPNQLKAARNDLASVYSPALKSAILVELERIKRDHEVSALSLPILDDMIVILRADLGPTVSSPKELSGEPLPERFPKPFGEPFQEPSDEPFEEPIQEPLPEPPGVGVGVGDELKVRTSNSSTVRKRTSATKKTTKPKTTTDRGTRIPEDFAETSVTANMVEWARTECPDVDGRRETEKFVNYWLNRTGQAALGKRWDRAWRNWLIKAQQDAEDRGRRNGTASPARVLAADDTERCTVRHHESQPARNCGLCRAEAMERTTP